MATVAIRLVWDPVPAEYDVSHYTITVDETAPIMVPADRCRETCSAPLEVAAGRHVFTLTATNATGTSPPATVTADIPGIAAPTGLRVVIAA